MRFFSYGFFHESISPFYPDSYPLFVFVFTFAGFFKFIFMFDSLLYDAGVSKTTNDSVFKVKRR